MEMHTIALIRGLMLAGLIWPLVIAGVVAAIRERRGTSTPTHRQGRVGGHS